MPGAEQLHRRSPAREPIGEVQLEFWAADEYSTELVLLRAQLPRWGSLGPLFYAFGLIDEDDLAAGVGSYGPGTYRKLCQ